MPCWPRPGPWRGRLTLQQDSFPYCLLLGIEAGGRVHTLGKCSTIKPLPPQSFSYDSLFVGDESDPVDKRILTEQLKFLPGKSTGSSQEEPGT